MRYDNISMLHDTMQIMEQGYYMVNGKREDLKLSRSRMEEARVYLPDDVEEICQKTDVVHTTGAWNLCCSCENMDSFALAVKRCPESGYWDCAARRILVLNLANPVHPGGGVRRGAKAQEEDLCRKSSLLLSLESAAARPYYEYNRSLNTYMGSDAIIITPEVEVIREENGKLMEESVVVSVMTCAAPMVRYGMEGMTDAEYQAMVYRRITGMLKTAAYLGYQRLVLGAFGCGAFGNDARIMSDLFFRALKEFNYDGMEAKAFFRRVDFAVLDHSADQYNYREFSRNFSHICREEEDEKRRVSGRIKKTEVYLDAIRGSLIGGAVGDALGYAVEFRTEKAIFESYGPNGITSYALDPAAGKALISDDTQMTLFTANGLLVWETREAMSEISAKPRMYVDLAYRDWLKTQRCPGQRGGGFESDAERDGQSWLLDVPELFERRAPGNTCLSALAGDRGISADYLKHPVNQSKGCGGIMRVAPLALRCRPGESWSGSLRELDLEGAQLAAITHGHSLGYMPAAVVTHVISRILTSRGQDDLKEIVLEAADTIAGIFAGDRHLDELMRIIHLAVELSENDRSDLDNIHQLGEGWVAEETLGIALYCSLKYREDFSAGVIAAVNHRGDSDSTGAVTGNILGALLGFHAIEDKWTDDLELYDVLLEMAEDLCHGCPLSASGSFRDPAWETKYVHMHRAL